jgi:Fur family transcriptional regulator, ferric uptake regulator
MGTPFRKTRQRDAIRTVLEAAARPLRADEVQLLARAEVPELGLATVYRTLKHMVDEGELAQVKLRTGAVRYEPAQRENTSFFLCESCSRAYPVDNEADSLNGHRLPPGFHLRRLELTLLGTCQTCSVEQSKTRVN